MSVLIDQIDAEVMPSPAPGAAPASAPAAPDQPETQMRRECALLERIAVRAARLRAD